MQRIEIEPNDHESGLELPQTVIRNNRLWDMEYDVDALLRWAEQEHDEASVYAFRSALKAGSQGHVTLRNQWVNAGIRSMLRMC